MDLGLRSDDRVVVLGSNGWLGSELQSLLQRRGCLAEIVSVPGPSSGDVIDVKDLQSLRPTVVLNFAFLTRERVEDHGEQEFRRVNAELIQRFLSLADRPTVRLALTVSSGAAITEPQHPYGQMKVAEEAAALNLATTTRDIVILRTYSVSGAHVRRPRDYAFSDLVLQAGSGHIRVSADRPVFRRYVWAQDALEVALINGTAGKTGIIETGGELLEMGDLAERVASVVNPTAKISRAQRLIDEPNAYHSDNSSWEEWVACTNTQPIDVDEQIALVAAALGASR